MCVHTPLKPSGFYQKGIWVETASLDIVPLSACKESFLCMCGKGPLLSFPNLLAKGGLLISSGMTDMWSGHGPASSVNCLPIILLEFNSIGN